MNNTKDIVIVSVKGLAKNCMSYVPIFGTMVDVYEEYAALQTQRKGSVVKPSCIPLSSCT